MIAAEVAQPLAARIVALYQIMQDPFDERRDDPQWKTLIDNCQARYRDLKRRVDFMTASRMAMEQAVATLIIGESFKE